VDLDEAHRREAAFHSLDRQEVRNLEALVHRAAKSPDLDRRLSSGYQTRVDATPCSSRGEQVEDGSQIATLVERITEALLVDDHVEPIAGQAQPIHVHREELAQVTAPGCFRVPSREQDMLGTDRDPSDVAPE